MARVFISHASADAGWAEQVREWLAEDGHETFLDQHQDDGILPGEDWEKRLYSELQAADAVVCVVTHSYIQSVWCAAEIGAARALGAELLPVRFSAGGELHTLLKTLQGLDADADPGGARERLRDRLAVIDGGGGRGWSDGRSPYPGLRPFDLGEHRVFFGRSREITQIAERLRSPERSTAAILTVVGASGCGKSSLVRAGVLPRIAGEDFWLPLPPIVPGRDPVGNLARAIAAVSTDRHIPFDVTALRTNLLRDGLNAVATDLLIAAGADNQCKLLVVIDQFEELLTQTEPDARAEFVAVFGPALGGPVQALATLRPEFLDALARDKELSKLARRIREVRPLETDALRAVIEKPAQIAGFEVDDELVTRLVTDTGSGTALPLLAFTLEQLAEGVTRGGRLSHQRYAEIGGVQGALQRQADAALQEACEEEGATRERIIGSLLSLVTIDEEGRPTKRSVGIDDASSAAGDLAPFISRRLLTTYTEGDRTVVAVVHEAFLANWPPLATEIDKQAAALRARRVVENAANEWVAGGRDVGALLHGPQLAKATVDTGAELTPISDTPRQWRAPRRLVTRVDINDTGREFLEASIRTDRSRRRRRIMQVGAVILTLALAAGFAFANYVRARDERNNARDSAVESTVSRLLLEADKILSRNTPGADTEAFFKLLAANKLQKGSADSGLLNAVLRRMDTAKIITTGVRVEDVAFSTDGKRLVSLDARGAVQTWDPRTGDLLGPERTVPLDDGEAPLALALSATDLRVASLWDVDSVRVQDTAIGLVGPDQTGLDAQVQAAALSFDGHRLATGGIDGTVRLRQCDTGQPVGPGTVDHGAPVLAVAFSRDGRRLATGGADDTVRVWDTRSGAPVATIPRVGKVRSVALSPDGHRLAVGSSENVVSVWSVDTAKRIGAPLTGHENQVTAVAFGTDADHLATGSSDETIRVWNLATDRPVTMDHPGQVLAAVLSGDSRRLVTGGADSSVQLWDAQSGHPIPLHNNIAGVFAAALSGDGRRLATGGQNGEVHVFDADRGDSIGDPRVQASPVEALALSSDGQRLASSGMDGTCAAVATRHQPV